MITRIETQRHRPEPDRNRARWIAVTALALAFTAASGCGGSSNDGPGTPIIPAPIVASFTPTATAATAYGVRLVSGATAGDTLTLSVAITGPTTNTDIYSYAFDLVLGDATVAQYVANSAQIGTALKPGTGQGTFVIAQQSANRVIVGVSKNGGGTGDSIGNGDEIVVSLRFRVLKSGATTLTFDGTPTNPVAPSANPVAINSVGTIIPTIDFDTAAATLRGS